MVRLRTVEPYHDAGYRRRRSGRGFSYLDESGHSVGSSERARAGALAIPPAWSDVWISERSNAHILAVGVDVAGRKQYIYHPEWRAARDGVKFERARALAAALPSARGRVSRDLAGDGLGEDRVLAASFRLLDLVAVRVGAEAYLEANGSFGLSTLLVRHVRLDGEVMRLAFPAKSGKRMTVEARDAALAVVAGDLIARTPRSRFLAWQELERFHSLQAGRINEYIRESTGGDFSAKDFRTLRGTIAAAEHFARAGAPASEREAKRVVREAYIAASEVLGNTPAIAKSSYVDPAVVDRFMAGETIALTGTPENALLALFPKEP